MLQLSQGAASSDYLRPFGKDLDSNGDLISAIDIKEPPTVVSQAKVKRESP